MTDKPLLAFCVSEDFDGHATIVFSASHVVARRKGADELDSEFGSVSCRRAHWADEFTPGPVPARAMLENGWWFEECTGCGRYMSGDDLYEGDDDDENPAAIDPVGTQHAPYCTEACRQAYLKRKARRERFEKKAYDVLAAELMRRYPGVTLAGPQCHHHKYVGRHAPSRRDRVLCISIAFQFPGSKYPGTYRYDLDHKAAKGTRQLWVANGDAAAWDAWRGLETGAAA